MALDHDNPSGSVSESKLKLGQDRFHVCFGALKGGLEGNESRAVVLVFGLFKALCADCRLPVTVQNHLLHIAIMV